MKPSSIACRIEYTWKGAGRLSSDGGREGSGRVPKSCSVLSLGVAVKATKVIPSSLPADFACICAASRSSVSNSPPSSSSASSAGDSTSFSLAAVSLVCEECASSAITAKRLPSVAASSRTLSSALGKVCSVHTTIFLPAASASASSWLLLAPSPFTTATTPWVRSKPMMASCNWSSSTVRSDTTTTVSKTLRLSASCRSARKCAVHAIELVLPEPAECWIRYLSPGPSRRTAATIARVASSWW